MSKHTPGPWIWDNNFNGLYGAGPDNEVLSYAGYEGMWLTDSPSREANARLIASAPDLLEALSEVVEFWDSIVPTDCINEMPIKARAAIAKASGSAT